LAYDPSNGGSGSGRIGCQARGPGSADWKSVDSPAAPVRATLLKIMYSGLSVRVLVRQIDYNRLSS